MGSSRRVLRFEVPVDDQWNVFDLSGPIIHVATRGEGSVEFWTIDDPDASLTQRAFRVVGTGHPLAPALAHHIGTAITPSGAYVWHLFEHARPGEVS